LIEISSFVKKFNVVKILIFDFWQKSENIFAFPP